MIARMSDAPVAVMPPQAHDDAQLEALWLYGKSVNTVLAYRADLARFREIVAAPVPQLTLAELHHFAATISELAASTQQRMLSTIKSLVSFAYTIGYVRFNVGAALPLPAVEQCRAERILTEEQIVRLITLEPKPRNRTLLRVLYNAGLRSEEACALTWRKAQGRDDTGQLTVYGKGNTTRAILLSAATWRELVALRGGVGDDAPIFRSQKRGHLDTSQVRRIVAAAAARAGLPRGVSPHWLRHAHASHALDRGASLTLVRDTLGHGSVATTNTYLHARPGDSSSRYLAL